MHDTIDEAVTASDFIEIDYIPYSLEFSPSYVVPVRYLNKSIITRNISDIISYRAKSSRINVRNINDTVTFKSKHKYIIMRKLNRTIYL